MFTACFVSIATTGEKKKKVGTGEDVTALTKTRSEEEKNANAMLRDCAAVNFEDYVSPLFDQSLKNFLKRFFLSSVFDKKKSKQNLINEKITGK